MISCRVVESLLPREQQRGNAQNDDCMMIKSHVEVCDIRNPWE